MRNAPFWRLIQNNRLYLLLTAVLLALFWLPRAPALESYATVDEAKWMLRSANFYQALYSGDLTQTYQSEHPGVTVTWAGMAGLIYRFRGYAGLSGEQMPGPTRFLRFLKQHHQDPAVLLGAGRGFMVLGIVSAHMLAFLAAIRIIGWWPAWLGFSLLALDPFPISLSRLLHLDGLSSALMLLSLLWFLDYLYCGKKRYALLISAAGAGLSWLTKSPAMFLIPFFALLCLFYLWQELQERSFTHLQSGAPLADWAPLSGLAVYRFSHLLLALAGDVGGPARNAAKSVGRGAQLQRGGQPKRDLFQRSGVCQRRVGLVFLPGRMVVAHNACHSGRADPRPAHASAA